MLGTSLRPEKVGRIAVYIRVSSKSQKYGKSNQLREIHEFLERQQWTTAYKLYEDDTTARKSVKNDVRPGYRKMLNDMHTKQFDTLVTWDIARLTRNWTAAGDLFERCKESHVSIASVSWNMVIDSTSDIGSVIFCILSLAADMDAKMKASNTEAGRESRRQNGDPLGGKPHKFKPSKQKEILDYYAEGHTWSEVMLKYNISRSYFGTLLKKARERGREDLPHREHVYWGQSSGKKVQPKKKSDLKWWEGQRPLKASGNE